MYIELDLFWGLIIGLIISLFLTKIYMTLANAIGDFIITGLKAVFLEIKHMSR